VKVSLNSERVGYHICPIMCSQDYKQKSNQDDPSIAINGGDLIRLCE
jgi:hypothetical protein